MLFGRKKKEAVEEQTEEKRSSLKSKIQVVEPKDSFASGEDEKDDSSIDSDKVKKTICETLRGERSLDFYSSRTPYNWYPSEQSLRQSEYVRNIEAELECMQKAFLELTTHHARLQFRLRQVINAPGEDRDTLLKDLESIAFGNASDCSPTDELPRIKKDLRAMGNVRKRQTDLLIMLRNQLINLEDVTIDAIEGFDDLLSKNDNEEEEDESNADEEQTSRKSVDFVTSKTAGDSPTPKKSSDNLITKKASFSSDKKNREILSTVSEQPGQKPKKY